MRGIFSVLMRLGIVSYLMVVVGVFVMFLDMLFIILFLLGCCMLMCLLYLLFLLFLLIFVYICVSVKGWKKEVCCDFEDCCLLIVLFVDGSVCCCVWCFCCVVYCCIGVCCFIVG